MTMSFLASLDFSLAICNIKSSYYMASEVPLNVKILSMTPQDRLWICLNLEGGSHITLRGEERISQ